MKILLTLSTTLMLLFSSISFAEPDHEGHVQIYFNHITALHFNGSAYPKYNSACQKQYKQQLHLPMDVTYSINPSTLIESAVASLQGQQITLYPAGIDGTYIFLSDGVPAALGEARIGFNINLSFSPSSATGFVMYTLSNAVEVSCVVRGKAFRELT